MVKIGVATVLNSDINIESSRGSSKLLKSMFLGFVQCNCVAARTVICKEHAEGIVIGTSSSSIFHGVLCVR